MSTVPPSSGLAETGRTSGGLAGFLAAILAGGASAAIFAAALTNTETALIFLTYFSAVPLFLAGLAAGSVSAIVASAVGSLGLFLFQPSNVAVIYTFIFSIPVLALTALSLRHRHGADGKVYWYPEGHILTALTIYPCIIFLLLNYLAIGKDGGLMGFTQTLLNTAFAPMKEQLDANMQDQLPKVIEVLAKYIPAVTGSCWIFIASASMAVSQLLLQKRSWNIRPSFDLRGIDVPGWLVFAVAGVGLVGYITPAPYNYIGSNLSIMLSVPFFIIGIAITHAWAATTRAPTFILVVFYILLSLIPWLGLLVALVGVVDQWANFRKRFASGPTDKLRGE